MELLNKIVRFVLVQLAILAALVAAPALLLTVPFALIALNPAGDFSGLTLAYMAAGPFVSAFWTMIVCMVRRYRRMTADGTPYECSFGGMVAATGYMLYGFFGTAVAEALFVPLFRAVSDSPLVFFVLAPFAVFAPLLLVWARNRYARL